MLTQTDIARIIEVSADLAPDMKRELLQILPKLYERVHSSLLLDLRIGEDFLVLLPLMAKEQIAKCWQALEEEGDRVEDMIEQMVVQQENDVRLQWQELGHHAKKILKRADETMSRASDQRSTQDIETAFSEDA